MLGAYKKHPQTYSCTSRTVFCEATTQICCIFAKEPEFYEYYNGQDEYPAEMLLHLSDAFMTKPEQIPLELEVKVLNINEHKGNKILQSCKPLAEYSIFVETVRRNIERDKEHGFENAIKECLSIDVHPCTSIEGKFYQIKLAAA